jgi:hypothetical protein
LRKNSQSSEQGWKKHQLTFVVWVCALTVVWFQFSLTLWATRLYGPDVDFTRNPPFKMLGLLDDEYAVSFQHRFFWSSAASGSTSPAEWQERVANNQLQQIGVPPYWSTASELRGEPPGWTVSDTAFGFPFRQIVLSEGIIWKWGTDPVTNPTTTRELKSTISWRRGVMELSFFRNPWPFQVQVAGVLWPGVVGNAVFWFVATWVPLFVGAKLVKRVRGGAKTPAIADTKIP